MIADYRFAQDAQGLQMLEHFATALNTARLLAETWPQQNETLLESLWDDLAWLEAFGHTLPPLKETLYFAQCRNVRFTLEQIRAALPEPQAPDLVHWQLPCFLQELREELYFWAYVHPFSQRWAQYYGEEFALHHQNEAVAQGTTQYEVSIFVPAKDNLDYTRLCVESILRETDAAELSYELILINHGSTDGTQSYFESIPNAKILHFKENVRMLMFASAMRVCQGRYMAFVSNDTVVTKDWLTLLHGCLKAMPGAISATPTTPHISNYQSSSSPYQNMEEMAVFASTYNSPNPAQWEERARIMPVIALYDLQKLNTLGFSDRYFRTMEFWDDDLSLRARRAGYQQILCRNVFCHHFGSITGKEAQKKENTLPKGRALFVAKHGTDPWGTGAYYDYAVCSRLQTLSVPAQKNPTVLGIDAGFGDTLLQIGNILQKHGKEPTIHSITTQEHYALDLKGICRRFFLAENEKEVHSLLAQEFASGSCDYIYLAQPLEHYTNWTTLLRVLCQKLAPEGWLVFSLSNSLHLQNVRWLLALDFPSHLEQMHYLNPQRVEALLKQRCQTVERQHTRSGIPNVTLAALAQQFSGSALAAEAKEQLLDTVSFLYYAKK